MIIPCEMASRAVVPSIRAMVAKELSESYNIKQENIARLLGITQSAVSQYIGNLRGRAIDLEGIAEVETVVKELSSILIIDSNSEIICKKFCEACRIIREKRLLCQLHARLDPLFNTEDCNICIPDTACI